MQSALDRVVDSFRRGLGIPDDIPKGVLKEVAEHASDQTHGEGIEVAIAAAIANSIDDA